MELGRNSSLPVLLMPHAAFGSALSAVNGDGSSALCPRVDQCYQVASQTINLPWQAIGDGFQTPFPRPVCRIATVYRQQGMQGVHLSGRLIGEPSVCMKRLADSDGKL
jgi:hypothetical protein